MKKMQLLITVTVFLFCLITEVGAIPIRDPHTHGPGTVTWSQVPIPPANPDVTNHQHNSNLDIRSNDSYDGYAAWDSERLFDGQRDMWSLPQGAGNDGVSAAPFGHGFIADDFISAIEYSFVGAGWNDGNRGLVNNAFAEWEREAKNRPNGNVLGQGGALIRNPNTEVGINFDEDTLFTLTNFEIRWGNIGAAGLAAQWFPDDSPSDPALFDLELVFNTGALFNNAGTSTDWSSNPANNEWDFYTVALHEVGHVLGLYHVDAGNGTNLMAGGAASFQLGQVHRFIDTSDLQGAIDLYSQPVPEPGTLSVLAIGLYLLFIVSKRNQRKGQRLLS